MSKHDRLKPMTSAVDGFTALEIERLAATRTPDGIRQVEQLLLRHSDMRRVVTEIRQVDPDQYQRIRIVPL